MKYSKLSNASRSWRNQQGLLGAHSLAGVPEPSNRAVPDSFLNSFAAEPATAASTTAGAIATVLAEKAFVRRCKEKIGRLPRKVIGYKLRSLVRYSTEVWLKSNSMVSRQLSLATKLQYR